jgi:hypothetical protein
MQIKGDLPANSWCRLGVGAFDHQDGRFLAKGALHYRILAVGALFAGPNLVIPAKAGTLTISYQWAQ